MCEQQLLCTVYALNAHVLFTINNSNSHPFWPAVNFPFCPNLHHFQNYLDEYTLINHTPAEVHLNSVQSQSRLTDGGSIYKYLLLQEVLPVMTSCYDQFHT